MADAFLVGSKNLFGSIRPAVVCQTSGPNDYQHTGSPEINLTYSYIPIYLEYDRYNKGMIINFTEDDTPLDPSIMYIGLCGTLTYGLLSGGTFQVFISAYLKLTDDTIFTIPSVTKPPIYNTTFPLLFYISYDITTQYNTTSCNVYANFKIRDPIPDTERAQTGEFRGCIISGQFEETLTA